MTDSELIIEQLKKALFEAYMDNFYSESEAREKVAFHYLLDDDSALIKQRQAAGDSNPVGAES